MKEQNTGRGGRWGAGGGEGRGSREREHETDRKRKTEQAKECAEKGNWRCGVGWEEVQRAEGCGSQGNLVSVPGFRWQ